MLCSALLCSLEAAELFEVGSHLIFANLSSAIVVEFLEGRLIFFVRDNGLPQLIQSVLNERHAFVLVQEFVSIFVILAPNSLNRLFDQV